MTGKEDGYLKGQLLLAMPNMTDPRFHKAVIYTCAHDEKGAMGLVLNHYLPGIDLGQLLDQLHIPVEAEKAKELQTVPVMSGGPVETARGFILHESDFEQPDTIKVDEHFSVTGTLDALKAIAEGRGPDRMRFILGYAGWSAGQLDNELQQNAWLVHKPSDELIFETDPDQLWESCVAEIGIDPAMLSGDAGRA